MKSRILSIIITPYVVLIVFLSILIYPLYWLITGLDILDSTYVVNLITLWGDLIEGKKKW